MNCGLWQSTCGRGKRFVFRVASTLPLVAALALAGSGAAARADLDIHATFDSSITSDPNAAAIEGAINRAITNLEASVATNITVSIDFQETGSGLGGSDTTIYTLSYLNYYNQLTAHATSPSQVAAIATLGPAPTSENPGNPVNGSDQIAITSANGRAIGLNTPGALASNGSIGTGGTFDSIISLNTSLTFPPGPNNGSKYGLQSVAAHEIDETLGIGGPGSTLNGSGSLTGAVGALDLYRYSAPGVRSYSNNAASQPYFSVDGGNTVVSYFNQVPGADFADWASDPIPPGYPVQVQDAFGMPGTDPILGPNELTALSTVGYDVILPVVPEPSEWAMVAVIGVALGGYRLGRRTRRAAAIAP